ncbi:UDP-glucose 4-epimerase [Thermosporothrix hazakensis]|jgi:nucleoside-diphosphate-sugar epimerase|uniref:UDP-glucose 4-epimerase n=2 Tax=Thermosporothrix TaxID=768650 RepID=A0A326U798_THEHA|nr:NAD(P)-dependent oxidoreductase [Thermosporothrix hazakensis]PZW29402.1 UDP-glucose 4-epimerase [Thermosporothrix hazakensis]BBH85689.1 oxidoreductase [Thermosporothrix sp. COM3]GCE45882.1 oxidoreductase [Thermosporothrix hazakensis]
MRILITGSSGQLGAEVASQLASRAEIVGVDLVPGRWTSHVVDILNRDAVEVIMQQVDAVIHTASLHARHLSSHSIQDFVNTNVTGTIVLLEAAARRKIRRFVYTSTTSIYGAAMEPEDAAVWVTEELLPQPRDIYDSTKLSAEELCRQFAYRRGVPVICLRIARFMPEPRAAQVLHRLYRGVDVRDAATAHILAVENKDIRFDLFNIAALSPFQESDTEQLLHDPVAVLRERAPAVLALFEQQGWPLPACIDRVYAIEKARQQLGYRPIYNVESLFVAESSTSKEEQE